MRVHDDRIELLQGSLQARQETTGSDAWTTTSDELGKFQAAESQKWGMVIKAAGIEPE